MKRGAEASPAKNSNLIIVHAKSGAYHLRISRADKKTKSREALKQELINLINLMINLEKF